jgi:hypothetical protein
MGCREGSRTSQNADINKLKLAVLSPSAGYNKVYPKSSQSTPRIWTGEHKDKNIKKEEKYRKLQRTTESNNCHVLNIRVLL